MKPIEALTLIKSNDSGGSVNASYKLHKDTIDTFKSIDDSVSNNAQIIKRQQ